MRAFLAKRRRAVEWPGASPALRAITQRSAPARIYYSSEHSFPDALTMLSSGWGAHMNSRKAAVLILMAVVLPVCMPSWASAGVNIFTVSWTCPNPPTTESDKCRQDGVKMFNGVGCKVKSSEEPRCDAEMDKWSCRAKTFHCSSVLFAENKPCPDAWDRISIGQVGRALPTREWVCRTPEDSNRAVRIQSNDRPASGAAPAR